MGIMDAKYIENANLRTYIGKQKHQIALRISHDMRPTGYRNQSRMYLKNPRNSLEACRKVKWNIGDRIKLKFKSGLHDQLYIYLNDKLLTILHCRLPETFFLAISP